MVRLSHADLESVLAFAAAAAATTAIDHAPRSWVIEHVTALIPSDAGSYVTTDRTASTQGSTRWWGACPVLHEHTLPSTNRGAPPTAPRLRELHVRHNPYYRHYERSASAATAVRLSDICDVAAFARTELAWAIGWSDAPYSMQLQVRRESMVSSYVTLDRAGREFSRRDRQVLSLLRPLLLAYETSLALRLEIERLLAESLPDPGIERRLTRREREILDLVAIGASNAVIAHQLAISPQTVRKHLENAYLKLEVNSRTEALARTGRAKSTASR